MNDIFASRLRAARKRKKRLNPIWTQEYVAELIGVARSTYTAYEGGSKQPPMETLNKLADVLDVSMDYLFGRSPGADAVAEPPAGYDTDWSDEEKELARIAASAFVEAYRKRRLRV